MHKVREINRMRELLSRAVNIASDLSNNKAILEAKNHIKKAIIELQNAENIQQNKKGVAETQNQKWWGTIKSGVANQPVANTAAQAVMRSFDEINSMIKEEQDKLDEIEKRSRPVDSLTQLLSD